MKKILLRINNCFLIYGINLIKLIRTIYGFPLYISDYIFFRQKIKKKDPYWQNISLYPIVDERFASSGTVKGHYFHQDLVIAQRIYIANPDIHLDVGSRVDGFVAHVASFRKIEVIDIRKPPSGTQNIKFIQHDIMKEPPHKLIEYCDSLSCLHALEHFGLGRYGDDISPYGYSIGLSNLTQLLKPGGTFYFSVPIGPNRIEFNAHRVFSIEYLLQLFNGVFEIKDFSYIVDNGNYNNNISLDNNNILSNYNCEYGCGIFILTKL